MEMAILNANPIPSDIVDSSPNKKADCYFYYYSSCNKGNACPFRHEPAALMNETMCVYWLNGNCNKPHCAYRHMEITKKRDKIPCFFESQPGGCKKLHCPFFHNNVKDRPREEDVPNNPDLILPVKDSESEYETEQSEAKRVQECVVAQIKLHRKILESNVTEHEKSPEFIAPSISRKSFIVPLQDAESDSESAIISPAKTSVARRTCVISQFERDWELERLKEIQKEEGNLLGYSFTSEEQLDDLDGDSYSDLSPILNQIPSDEEYFEEDEVSNGSIIIQREATKSQRITVAEDEPYLFVKRALGSTLKQRPQIKLLKESFPNTLPNSNPSSTPGILNRHCLKVGHHNALPERSGLKATPLKRSIKERLGKRRLNELDNDHNHLPIKHLFPDESLEGRLGLKDDNVKSRLSLKEDRIKYRIAMKEDSDPKSQFKDKFVIKSLADIRAEKERQKQNNQIRNNIKAPEIRNLNSIIGNKKDFLKEEKSDVGNIKVKTLAEIKAEKNKSISLKSQSLKPVNTQSKRPISPVEFSNHKNIKLSHCSNHETESNHQPPISFSSRKLTFKKLTSCVGKSDDQSNFPGDSKTKPYLKSHMSNSCKVDTLKTEENVKCVGKKLLEMEEHKQAEQNKISCTQSTIDSNSYTSSNEENKVDSQAIRQDSFIDEEELLLQEDLVLFNDEDIDEEELLL